MITSGFGLIFLTSVTIQYLSLSQDGHTDGRKEEWDKNEKDR